MKFLSSIPLLFLVSPALAAMPPIIGGQTVETHDFIAHSVVALLSTQAQGQALCTASLVANDLAITAAHCVADGPASLHAKLTLIFSGDLHHASAADLRTVDRAEIPKEWNPASNQAQDTSDVALLHFSGGLPSGYVISDLLPFDSVLSAGDTAVLAGYGISDALSEEGAGALRRVQVQILNPHYSPTEVELDQRHGGGACHGDSGGPAYVTLGGHPYLFGITSRGGGNCDQDVIYSQIGAYADWFAEAVKRIHR